MNQRVAELIYKRLCWPERRTMAKKAHYRAPNAPMAPRPAGILGVAALIL